MGSSTLTSRKSYCLNPMNTNIPKPTTVQKNYSTSYYLATLLFPENIKLAVFSFYGFLREIDEIVDSMTHTSDFAKNLIEKYRSEWNAYLDGAPSTNQNIKAFAYYYTLYKVPHEYTESYFESMIQDTFKSRYATYRELEDYMYGSATIVGYTMSLFIGHKEGALPFAKKLSEAMQLTNFLRDIKEDYELRDRIYIPEESLTKFGVTEEHFKRHIVDDNFKSMMKFEVARARRLYADAEEGIDLLDRHGRLAVRVASRFYEAILDAIVDADYNVFTKRNRISNLRKVVILIKTIVWKKRK